MNRRYFMQFAAVAAVAASLNEMSSARAARRPAPTPTPVVCPGVQTWNGTKCVCLAGKFKCGPDCCNAFGQCCDGACCGDGLVCGAEEICIPA